MRLYLSICLLCFTLGLSAQVPAPAPPQESPLYITGATAHLGNGEVVEDAVLAFVNGIITFVGTAEEAAERSWNGYERIDAAGKHLYPGFIATASTLGLVDISAVRATRDYNETGSMNPVRRRLCLRRSVSAVRCSSAPPVGWLGARLQIGRPVGSC